MGTIHLNEIKAVLKELLGNKISRETAADWALKLRESEDSGSLEYIPKESEQIIWKGILFIEGIDLKDSPNSYLHNNFDIELFLRKL